MGHPIASKQPNTKQSPNTILSFISQLIADPGSLSSGAGSGGPRFELVLVAAMAQSCNAARDVFKNP